MRYTTRLIYAIKAMLSLSSSDPKRPMSIQTIKKRFDIPENYLAHILADLRKSGLIKSLRGTGGGYFLVKNPAQISLKDIIIAIEGESVFMQKNQQSNQDIDHVLNKILAESIESSLRVFKNISILDLSLQVDHGKVLDFVI